MCQGISDLWMHRSASKFLPGTKVSSAGEDAYYD